MTDNIPLDMWREILVRLPAECLIGFRAVSKGFRTVIDDPCFAREHTNKHQHQLSSSKIIIHEKTTYCPVVGPFYSLDLQTLKNSCGHQTITAVPLDFDADIDDEDDPVIFSSCNGLFLTEKPALRIFNPLTHERLDLPPPAPDFPIHKSSRTRRRRSRMTHHHTLTHEPLGFPIHKSPSSSAFGIGYDSATDDYKAVVILSSRDQTHIYSLKSDSWRKAAMNCPWRDNGCNGWVQSGVYLSGVLHWIFRDKVIALDLGTEKYRQWWVPRFQERHGDKERVYGTYRLVVLDGRLMVSDYGYGSKNYDVWVMKDYWDDQEDSWIKLFSMSPDFVDLHGRIVGGLRPVAFLKNKTQIFMQCYSGFYLFDVKSLSMKVVRIHGLTGETYAQVFHWSIFRLHDNCGVGGRVKTQRTRITKRVSMSRISDHTEFCFCVRKPKFYNSRKEEEEDCLRDSCGSGDND